MYIGKNFLLQKDHDTILAMVSCILSKQFIQANSIPE